MEKMRKKNHRKMRKKNIKRKVAFEKYITTKFFKKEKTS